MLAQPFLQTTLGCSRGHVLFVPHAVLLQRVKSLNLAPLITQLAVSNQLYNSTVNYAAGRFHELVREVERIFICLVGLLVFAGAGLFQEEDGETVEH